MKAKDLIKKIKKHTGKDEYEIDLAETLRLICITFSEELSGNEITATLLNYPNLPDIPSITFYMQELLKDCKTEFESWEQGGKDDPSTYLIERINEFI